MTLAHTVYVLDAVIFALMMTWMFVYNARVKAKIKRIEASGRHIHSAEEGIAIVTLEKERASGKSANAS
jgi:hypothetical protein